MANNIGLIQKESDLNESVKVLSVDKANLIADIQTLRDDKEILKESIKTIITDCDKRIEDSKFILDSARIQADLSNDLYDYVESEKKRIEKKSIDFESFVDETKQKLDQEISKNASEVEELKTIKSKLETNIKFLQSEQERYIDANNSILSEIDTSLEKKHHLIESVKERIHEFGDKQSEMNLEITNLENKIKTLTEELKSKEDTIESIRKELLAKERNIEEREANLMILKSRFQLQIQQYFPDITIKI